MLFNLSFYLALAVLVLGLAWRLWSWLSRDVGSGDSATGPGPRLGAFFSGLGRVLARPSRLGALCGAFFLDVLGQRRVFRESPWRWAAHQGIFWGFVLLVLMHALERQVSENIFNEYYSTVNPYLFLRDLLGFLVALGLAVFAWRRWKDPVVRRTSGPMDTVILVLLAVIILSGFAVKAAKIISQPRFNEMVQEYGGPDEGEDRIALEAFWQDKYGVVFSGDPRPLDGDILEQGREIHQDSCAPCHSRPQAAGVSWVVSRVFSPVGSFLNSFRADVWLWRIHFLACFLAMALVPFSKLLHIVTTPLSLLADAVSTPAQAWEDGPEKAPNRLGRRALGLDACTHCAVCSQHCSVMASFTVTDNELTLPSQKLAAVRDMGHASGPKLAELRHGADLCTRCRRCTNLCPAGIDLQDLWLALDRELTDRGVPSSYRQARSAQVDNQRAHGGDQPRPLEVTGQVPALGILDMALEQGYFRYCFQCQTCSNVCPVVSCYPHPGESLGLLPHQIMYSLELGLVDQAMAAGMTWDCATCYQCQQHCPQGVPVADLLYELRNQGFWLQRRKEA